MLRLPEFCIHCLNHISHEVFYFTARRFSSDLLCGIGKSHSSCDIGMEFVCEWPARCSIQYFLAKHGTLFVKYMVKPPAKSGHDLH